MRSLGCRSSENFSPVCHPGARNMTTLLPPPSKRAKLSDPVLEPVDLSTVTGNVLCQFRASDTGETTGSTIRIPAKTTAKELELLLNQLLNNVYPQSWETFTDRMCRQMILFRIPFLLSPRLLPLISRPIYIRISSTLVINQQKTSLLLVTRHKRSSESVL